MFHVSVWMDVNVGTVFVKCFLLGESSECASMSLLALDYALKPGWWKEVSYPLHYS